MTESPLQRLKAESESKPDPVPARPSPDRAAWLLHAVSSIGRLSIQTEQYEELRGLAIAQKAEIAKLQAALKEKSAPRASSWRVDRRGDDRASLCFVRAGSTEARVYQVAKPHDESPEAPAPALWYACFTKATYGSSDEAKSATDDAMCAAGWVLEEEDA